MVEGACLVEDGRAPDEGTLTEVARFCGAVLEPGGAGGRCQGLERWISVRWTRKSVVRVAETAQTGRRDGQNHGVFLKSFSLSWFVFSDFFSRAGTDVLGVSVLELGEAVGLAVAGVSCTFQCHVNEAKKWWGRG